MGLKSKDTYDPVINYNNCSFLTNKSKSDSNINKTKKMTTKTPINYMMDSTCDTNRIISECYNDTQRSINFNEKH